MSTMYCRECGKSISDAAVVCPHCGARQADPEISGADAFEQQHWSGFWRRVGAQLVDGLIIFIPICVVVGTLAFVLFTLKVVGGRFSIAVLVAELLVYAVYQAALNSSRTSATWGRRAVGIAVVDANTGETLGFGRAFLRAAISFISGVFIVPQLLQLVTPKRQSLADLLSGAVVVQRKPGSAGAIIAAVVLVVSVPLVGILAAIAIPAYQDYVIRAKVTAGLTLANSAKPTVAYNASLGAEDLGDSVPTLSQSKIIESLRVDRNGVITVTMAPEIKGVQFALTPYVGNVPLVAGHKITDPITWRCAVSEARNDRYAPVECRV
jgi:type IV pilus assembly protein PilA